MNYLMQPVKELSPDQITQIVFELIVVTVQVTSITLQSSLSLTILSIKFKVTLSCRTFLQIIRLICHFCSQFCELFPLLAYLQTLGFGNSDQ